MLRFVIKKRWARVDEGGASGEQLITFTADVPELEHYLRAGGMSQNGFEIYDMVGAEIIKDD